MALKYYFLLAQLPILVWSCASDLSGAPSKTTRFDVSFFAPLQYSYPPDGAEMVPGQSLTQEQANRQVKVDLNLAISKGLTDNQIYLFTPPTLNFTFKAPEIHIVEGEDKCVTDGTYVAIKGTVIYKCTIKGSTTKSPGTGPTKAPPVSSSTKAPVNDGSSTKVPEGSSSTKAPVIGSSTKAPEPSSSTNAPVSGSTDASETSSSSTKSQSSSSTGSSVSSSTSAPSSSSTNTPDSSSTDTSASSDSTTSDSSTATTKVGDDDNEVMRAVPRRRAAATPDVSSSPFVEKMNIIVTSDQPLFQNQWEKIGRSVVKALEDKKWLFDDEIKVTLL